MTTLEETNARNERFTREYFHGKIEMKCYDCEMFTYYGKTCRGDCDREEKRDG